MCATPRKPADGARLVDGSRGSDRVELVRVVQNRCLGASSGAGVVMNGHRVEQLGANRCLEYRSAILDQPQAQMHVAEQPALLGRSKRWPALELERPADIVHQCGGE